MAVNTYKKNVSKNSTKKVNTKVNRSKAGSKKAESTKSPEKRLTFRKDRRFQLTMGFFLMICAFYLLIACLGYLFTGKADQSIIEALADNSLKDSGLETKNWLGLLGAYVSHYFIFRWFGVAAFLIPPLIFLAGYRIVFRRSPIKIWDAFVFVSFFLFWISIFMGYFITDSDTLSEWGFLCGGIGYEMAMLSRSLIGWGTILMLMFALIAFIIYFYNVTSLALIKPMEEDEKPEPPHDPSSTENTPAQATQQHTEEKTPTQSESEAKEEDSTENDEELQNWTVKVKEDTQEETAEEGAEKETETATIQEKKNEQAPQQTTESAPQEIPQETAQVEEEPQEAISFSVDETVEKIKEKKEEQDEELEFQVEAEEKKEKTATKVENYDPTLDLPRYTFPTPELLIDYGPSKVQVSKEELEANKDKIVETLVNFKIGISSIKATIGPTITLYEIVPEAGVKISKIKNLEDDIALSLAALGIRIIAPIPGRGTIGIEVPNKNKEMVSMQSVISTQKFMKSDKELPIALGKTISNEVFIGDLAKMPHLLIAGATGQGKSVGLNAILTSLVFKKHPSQLKFVLVDPKKVELTLFNKIEQHFLAKLPDAEEAIITDTKKVINTLNSLCIEMDNRYDLLKDAGCRNLKEYNKKFVNRRLNPEKGHRFMPYIVLVIDELADLMMTAGKEVETPIARLAQLARAVGLHLIVATQRPSVNVITGIIKANFPARLSFRVTSKVDSRTILDTGGAEQLIGQGDMLLSQGSDITRMQCAFVDTPEVEKICEYIGDQMGYDSAYELPEYIDDDSDKKSDVNLDDRDVLFDDAARVVVTHQQGSTSLIQRKLKLGYNRAGRIIDQLEAAGIVGPFEGSKAREVLIPDEYSLEQLLNTL